MLAQLLPRTLLVILFLIAGISNARPDQNKPLKVFILAGQSNMVGQGKRQALPKEVSAIQKDVLAGDRPILPGKSRLHPRQTGQGRGGHLPEHQFWKGQPKNAPENGRDLG